MKENCKKEKILFGWIRMPSQRSQYTCKTLMNFPSNTLSMRIKYSLFGLLCTGKRAVSSGHGLYWVDRTDCGGPEGGPSHRSCRGKHLEEKVTQHQQDGGDTRH